MVKHQNPNAKVFVFDRSVKEREFSGKFGAVWSVDIDEGSPEKLDCIIDTTPAWLSVIESLKNLEQGGKLVINAIGKEEADKESLLGLDYPVHLCLEKAIKSVANMSKRC